MPVWWLTLPDRVASREPWGLLAALPNLDLNLLQGWCGQDPLLSGIERSVMPVSASSL
jgi:hypothetical protein